MGENYNLRKKYCVFLSILVGLFFLFACESQVSTNQENAAESLKNPENVSEGLKNQNKDAHTKAETLLPSEDSSAKEKIIKHNKVSDIMDLPGPSQKKIWGSGPNDSEKHKDEGQTVDLKSVSAQILKGWNWFSYGDNTRITGYVSNTGTENIGYMEILADYLNKEGQSVGTYLYVYNNLIRPKHFKRFSLIFPAKDNIESVKIQIENIEKAEKNTVEMGLGLSGEIKQDWTWGVEGDFSRIDGKIKNTGNKAISYYQIMAEYKDDQGQVFDSAYTNANKMIEPGGEIPFQILNFHESFYTEVSIYIKILQ